MAPFEVSAEIERVPYPLRALAGLRVSPEPPSARPPAPDPAAPASAPPPAAEAICPGTTPRPEPAAAVAAPERREGLCAHCGKMIPPERLDARGVRFCSRSCLQRAYVARKKAAAAKSVVQPCSSPEPEPPKAAEPPPPAPASRSDEPAAQSHHRLVGADLDDVEREAVQKALAAGKITRIENGSWPDNCRPELRGRAFAASQARSNEKCRRAGAARKLADG